MARLSGRPSARPLAEALQQVELAPAGEAGIRNPGEQRQEALEVDVEHRWPRLLAG